MGSADAHPALVVLGAGSSDSDTESRPAAGTCVLLSTECRIALCALPCLFLFGLPARQVRPPAGGSVSRSAIHSRIRSPIRWGLVLALRVLRILTRRVLTRDRRRGVDGGSEAGCDWRRCHRRIQVGGIV